MKNFVPTCVFDASNRVFSAPLQCDGSFTYSSLNGSLTSGEEPDGFPNRVWKRIEMIITIDFRQAVLNTQSLENMQ